MKRAIFATAAALVAAGSASAQILVYDPAAMIPSDELTESDLYTTSTEDAWTADTAFTAFDEGWEAIGEVEELILDQSGQVVGIVAEVGGFLGLGEHDVFVPSEDLRLVQRDDGWVYLTRYTQEELEELPELEDDVWDD